MTTHIISSDLRTVTFICDGLAPLDMLLDCTSDHDNHIMAESLCEEHPNAEYILLNPPRVDRLTLSPRDRKELALVEAYERMWKQQAQL